jgi:hypothetical protein
MRTGKIKFIKALKVSFLINLFSAIGAIAAFNPFHYLFGYPTYQVSSKTLAVGAVAILLFAGHCAISRSKLLLIVGSITIIIGIIILNIASGIKLSYFNSDRLFLTGLTGYFFYSFGLTLALELWPAKLAIALDKLDKAVLYANIWSHAAMTVAFIFREIDRGVLFRQPSF